MIENNPQKYIGAAFDSINLINNTILKVINEKNISIIISFWTATKRLFCPANVSSSGKYDKNY
jgi:hypothetical protein